MNAIGMAIGVALVWSCSCGAGGSEYVAEYVLGRYVTCDGCGHTFFLSRVVPHGDSEEADRE